MKLKHIDFNSFKLNYISLSHFKNKILHLQLQLRYKFLKFMDKNKELKVSSEFWHCINPLSNKEIELYAEAKLGSSIIFYNGKNKKALTSDVNLAIISISDDRNSENKGTALAPEIVRNYLYKLSQFPINKKKIIDLGSVFINEDQKIEECYFAMQFIVEELIKHDIVTIIIGGSQDYTIPVYKAFDALEQTVNITTIDYNLCFGAFNKPICSDTFMNSVILQRTNYLFNYTAIAYQSCFVDVQNLDMVKDLLFDYIRLGIVQEKIQNIEAILRDTHILSFDIGAIQSAFAPGHYLSSPNGLTAKEACQLAFYAGFSDKMTFFGMFETNPNYDINGRTSHLTAQIIWYFLSGFYTRKADYPFKDISSYKKEIVYFSDMQADMVFYHSLDTDRWWVEVPYKNTEYTKSLIVACNVDDYKKACENEIPERWWKIFQKIN